MKTVVTIALTALASTLCVPAVAAAAAADMHGGHDAMTSDMNMPSHRPADTPMVEGTVKKIDKAAGKVTLAHGPLTHLGMNMPMTMVFRVKDAAWLEQMKDGDKIRFAADNVNGVMTVVGFEPAR